MMASDQPLDTCKKEDEDEKPQNGDVHKVLNGSTINHHESKDINENINLVAEETIVDSKTGEKKLLEVTMNENNEKNPQMEHHFEENLLIDIEESSATQTETLLEIQGVVQQTFTTTIQKNVMTTAMQEIQEMVNEKLPSKDETQDDFEEIERRIEAEEALATDVEISEQYVEDNGRANDEEEILRHISRNTPENDDDDDIPDHVDSPDSLETIEIPDGNGDFEHYVVLDGRSKSNEVVTNGNDEQDFYYLDDNSVRAESSQDKNISQNGEADEKTFDDHFVLDTREAISPIDDGEKKESSAKKSGGIHVLGVQKTEQPYSICTTETKIAMEIREMREREEELKLMRERQAQLSPIPPQPQQQLKKSPVHNIINNVHKPSVSHANHKAISTPGYRVSSVFGSRGITQSTREENKFGKNVHKETAVEKEIRLAKEREEELRSQKGLPPREDDSYVKPSEVKSSQAKAFNRLANSENSRLLATAKIQNEIQEQTLRELALRESGHIQTLSSERTDAKVTKLKTLDITSPECISPTFHNNNGYSNGTSSNGYMSPDSIGSKRSTPSPTGSNYCSQYSGGSRNAVSPNCNSKAISMQKFINSRGKETTFAATRNGPFHPKTDNQDGNARSIAEAVKLKRTISVESKIQQEILEMQLREEELKLLHCAGDETHENGYESIRSPVEYHQNGNEDEEMEKSGPRKNNLFAQWEQRIQKSEGKV